jgi:hypothetical protein
MPSYIDESLVKQLIETQAATAGQPIVMVHSGESLPADADVLAVMASFEMTRRPRRNRDDAAFADIRVVFAVSVNEVASAQSAYAVATAIESMSRVLEVATLVSGAHKIHLFETSTLTEHGGEIHQALEALVSVRGEVRCDGSEERVTFPESGGNPSEYEFDDETNSMLVATI